MAGSILIAHDQSERSQAVVECGVDLAVRLGSDVTVIFVMDDEDLQARRSERPEDTAFTDIILTEAEAELHETIRLQTELPDGLELRVMVVSGEPPEVLLKYMKDHEFTVIGVRSRSKVGKLLFGSVPQSILLRSGGKVVAVPV